LRRRDIEKPWQDITLEDLPLPGAVCTYDLNKQETLILQSTGEFKAVKLRDAMLATSAAPVYLPVYRFELDGGVWANDPRMMALFLLRADSYVLSKERKKVFDRRTPQNENEREDAQAEFLQRWQTELSKREQYIFFIMAIGTGSVQLEPNHRISECESSWDGAFPWLFFHRNSNLFGVHERQLGDGGQSSCWPACRHLQGQVHQARHAT
jgi:hypothetical protein